MRKVFAMFVLFLFTICASPAQMQDTNAEFPAVVVPNTQVIVLTSTTNEHDYRISIALPASYASSEQTYPVLYVLDPIISFLSTTETVRYLNWANELPELIVVGIGYPSNIIDEWLAPRERDYHLYKDKFLDFIEEELFPLIDSTYRTDSTDRAIIGYSYGGEFVLYTLVSRPELFNGYIAIDSYDASWLDPLLVGEDEELISQFAGRDVRLFIADAGIEYYSAGIQARKYDGLTATGLSLGDATHWAALHISLPVGIHAIYAK